MSKASIIESMNHNQVFLLEWLWDHQHASPADVPTLGVDSATVQGWLEDMVRKGVVQVEAQRTLTPLITREDYEAWRHALHAELQRIQDDPKNQISVPVHMVETIARYRSALARLTQEQGRAPSPGELAQAMALTPEKIARLRKIIDDLDGA